MNKKFLAGAIAATALLPLFAFADTDAQSQIQSLMSQIKALQEQLHTLMGSSTHQWMNASSTMDMPKPPMDGMNPGQMGKMMCLNLNRNLRVGAHGDDVKQLQETLSNDEQSDFHGNATGFFGPLTAKALVKFQMHMGIASSSDGSVGPMTRGFFERRCGKGLDGEHGMNDNMGTSSMNGNGRPNDDHHEGMGGNQNGGMNMGMITGAITTSGASSITVSETSGASHVVNFSASTTIKIFASTSTPPVAGTSADLTVGKNVHAMGMIGSDKSLTAAIILIGTFPPMPMPGSGDGPKGMMPMMNGPQGGQGDQGGHGGPQH